MSEIISRCLAFLLGLLIGKLFVSFCKRIIEHYRKNEQVTVDNVTIFSTSKYLEEIEKVHLSILEEQENREPYIITLWWGLDGCRLNDTGEVEWISRRAKKNPPASLPKENSNIHYYEEIQDILGNRYASVNTSVDSAIQQMTGNINSSIQSQIDSIQRLQFQAAQMAQYDYINNIVGRDFYGRIIRR